MRYVIAVCLVLVSASAAAQTRFYVATNEPGASNDRCNGSRPVDEGNGNCPFKDFQSTRVRSLLVNAIGVTVYVRSGIYTPDSAILLQGLGTSWAQAVTLTGYSDERPILDGRNALREVVRFSGSYTALTNIEVRNARGYNGEVRGGAFVLIANNVFGPTLDSDSLKGDGGAHDVTVRQNRFTGYRSQAIDLAGVSRWDIQGNTFEPGATLQSKCIGIKFASEDIRIRGNSFRGCAGLAMGGVSSLHPNTFEAKRVTVDRNTFTALPFLAADVYSCIDCQFSYNTVAGAAGGIRLGGNETQGPPGCRNGAGCDPVTRFIARANTLQKLAGNANAPPNVFWIVGPKEQIGFAPSGSTYCAVPNAPAVFVLGTLLTFPQWVTATSDTSVMPACVT
jgi:hypothetical protein